MLPKDYNTVEELYIDCYNILKDVALSDNAQPIKERFIKQLDKEREKHIDDILEKQFISQQISTCNNKQSMVI